jgi:hypothetical protein
MIPSLSITMIACRADGSILKVIVMLSGTVSHGGAAVLHCCHRGSVDEEATRGPHAKH